MMNIAIASGKGGTGKTTIAMSLAACYARNGMEVAILDCDVKEPKGRHQSGQGRHDRRVLLEQRHSRHGNSDRMTTKTGSREEWLQEPIKSK
jgi:Mrp family chromosome partitioning ATPase